MWRPGQSKPKKKESGRKRKREVEGGGFLGDDRGENVAAKRSASAMKPGSALSRLKFMVRAKEAKEAAAARREAERQEEKRRAKSEWSVGNGGADGAEGAGGGGDIGGTKRRLIVLASTEGEGSSAAALLGDRASLAAGRATGRIQSSVYGGRRSFGGFGNFVGAAAAKDEAENAAEAYMRSIDLADDKDTIDDDEMTRRLSAYVGGGGTSSSSSNSSSSNNNNSGKKRKKKRKKKYNKGN